MSMYYPNLLYKGIDLHKEEENVGSEGKDQEYISQKLKKKVRARKVRIQKNKMKIHNITLY